MCARETAPPLAGACVVFIRIRQFFLELPSWAADGPCESRSADFLAMRPRQQATKPVATSINASCCSIAEVGSDGSTVQNHRLSRGMDSAHLDRYGRLGGLIMVVYPLSAVEERLVWWVSRIAPVMAIAVIGFLGVITVV